MTFRPRSVMCRLAGEPVRPAVYFVSNPRRRAGGLPDCADLTGLKPCSAGDSKDDVGTIPQVGTIGVVPKSAQRRISAQIIRPQKALAAEICV